MGISLEKWASTPIIGVGGFKMPSVHVSKKYVVITADEWYPVYTARLDPGEDAIAVDPATWRRWHHIQKQFAAMQGELAAIRDGHDAGEMRDELITRLFDKTSD